MKSVSVVCAFLFTGISTVNAADLYVSAGGSIQAAVDSAGPGDTIHVAKGSYVENINILGSKTGLTIVGEGKKTKIISAGGVPGEMAPAGVPVDIVIDIFASGVTIANLTVQHPAGGVVKRDVGVFFKPPATNGRLTDCKIDRRDSGELGFGPGSRGVLVFRATGIKIDGNDFKGNYEDHIHLPTSSAEVVDNEVEDATRLGIVVIQESATSSSINNVIMNNEVEDSGSDGIQIQGDGNTVVNNEVEENGGAGIRLCGPTSSPACSAPGGSASADNNVVTNNEIEDNAGGGILDFGIGNTVNNNDDDDDDDSD